MDKVRLILILTLLNLTVILSQTSNDGTNYDTCFSIEDSSYVLKSEKDECLSNDWKEYSEISPVCIICEDALNKY